MRISTLVSSIALAGFLSTGAFAATAATKPAATTPAATATTVVKKTASKMTPEQKAISKKCSDLADAKKLHGKDREKFRAECKKDGGKMPS